VFVFVLCFSSFCAWLCPMHASRSSLLRTVCCGCDVVVLPSAGRLWCRRSGSDRSRRTHTRACARTGRLQHVVRRDMHSSFIDDQPDHFVRSLIEDDLRCDACECHELCVNSEHVTPVRVVSRVCLNPVLMAWRVACVQVMVMGLNEHI
jgi:hypothetical protein